MKNVKFKLFIGLVAVGSLLLSACGDDGSVDVKKPQLNFLAGDGYTSGDGDIVRGSEFKVGLSASHDSKIESLMITVSYDGGPQVAPLDCNLCDTTINETSFTLDFVNKVAETAGSETWSFTITDKAGESTTKTITFNRTAVPVAVRKIDITLGNQNSSNVGSSLNMTDMSVSLLAAARTNSANIDLIYVVNENGNSYFGAPSSDDVNSKIKTSDWATRNKTKIRKTSYSVAQFGQMTDSKELLMEVASSAGTSQYEEITSGDVFFVNPVSASGKYALVKINSIGVDNTISLEVLVEER